MHHNSDALAKLKARPRPCVILLDLMMPVMNGWEFREALRDEPALRDVPVVVVSALNKEMAENARVSACLPKPVDLDRMLEIVAEHCDGDHCTTESSRVSHP